MSRHFILSPDGRYVNEIGLMSALLSAAGPHNAVVTGVTWCSLIRIQVKRCTALLLSWSRWRHRGLYGVDSGVDYMSGTGVAIIKPTPYSTEYAGASQKDNASCERLRLTTANQSADTGCGDRGVFVLACLHGQILSEHLELEPGGLHAGDGVWGLGYGVWGIRGSEVGTVRSS